MPLVMGKKRKHAEAETAAAQAKKDEVAPERPKRTLLGWKKKTQEGDNDAPHVFRNKEKVLVTCSRRINFRYCVILHISSIIL